MLWKALCITLMWLVHRPSRPLGNKYVSFHLWVFKLCLPNLRHLRGGTNTTLKRKPEHTSTNYLLSYCHTIINYFRRTMLALQDKIFPFAPRVTPTRSASLFTPPARQIDNAFSKCAIECQTICQNNPPWKIKITL